MSDRKSQLNRVKTKLARDGFVTRNECLRQYPAIARLSARIQDLEDKHGYVFETEDTGRDYVYKLISIDGVPAETPEQINKVALAAFDAA